MMRVRGVVRDVVLIAAAVAVGWWARGGDMTVMAQRSGASQSGDGGSELAFQMIGTGPASTLAMYNPGNKTLYVYPQAGAGNSMVSCGYSFTISAPGAPLERKNCPVGEMRR